MNIAYQVNKMGVKSKPAPGPKAPMKPRSLPNDLAEQQAKLDKLRGAGGVGKLAKPKKPGTMPKPKMPVKGEDMLKQAMSKYKSKM